YLGVGLASLTEALGPQPPAGRAMAACAIFAAFEREVCRNELGPARAHAGQNGKRWAGRQPQPSTLPKSGIYIAPESANLKSPAVSTSAEPPSAGSSTDLIST